jgi:hypothetical protein
VRAESPSGIDLAREEEEDFITNDKKEKKIYIH